MNDFAYDFDEECFICIGCNIPAEDLGEVVICPECQTSEKLDD